MVDMLEDDKSTINFIKMIKNYLIYRVYSPKIIRNYI
jgi:hypothetical protein